MIAMQNLGNPSRSDNEPLNPASSEPDTTPTRSVLDALKEISRKRINNEELDAERIKKQCKDISEVDSPPFQNTLSDFSGSISDLMYRNPMVIQKRPRESVTQQGGQLSPQSAELEKQKKRLCTKNNEVLSSLSSSISLDTPKRKTVELNTPKGLDLNKEPPEDTPVVSVPVQQPQIRSGVIKEVPQSNQVPVVKKLTLFNKKYDEKSAEVDQLQNESNTKRNRFVKPNEAELENPIEVVKKVEQSKLAILLQCLAGELDDDGEDMVDSRKKEKEVETSVNVTVKEPEAPKEAPVLEVPTQPILPSVVEDKQDKKEEEPAQKPEKPVVSFNLPQPVKSVPELIQPSPTKPMFSFGVPAATTTSTNITPAVSTSVISSAPSTGVITSLPKSNVAANTSFLFGNISNTDALPKPLISAPTSAFTPTGAGLQPKPSFTFGTNNSQSREAQTTSTVNTTPSISQTSKIGTSSFVFGGSGSAGNSEPAKSAIPTFGSIASSASNTTMPGPVPTSIVSSAFSTPTAASSMFGAFETPKSPVVSQPQTQPPSLISSAFKIPVTPSSASPQQGAQNTFFGSPNITSGTSTTSIFGASAVNNSSFNQPGSKVETSSATTNNQTSAFGTPSTTSTFNFGSANPASTPAFGQNSIFGTAASTANQTPGGFSFKSPPSNQGQATSGGFSLTSNQGPKEPAQKPSVFSRLGSTVTTPSATVLPNSATSPSKSLFTFTSPTQGTQGQTATQPAFGSNMTNVSNISQTSSIFGGNTTLNSTSQNTTIFGNAVNNASEMGSGSNLFGNSQTQQQPQRKEALSGIEQIFSSPATSNPPPAFQSNMGFGSGQKSAFTFGSNNNNNNNVANSTNTPFAFGQSSVQTQENKPFAFGAGNPSAPPAYPGSQQSQSNQESPSFNFSSQGTNSPFGTNNNNNNNAGQTFGIASITPSPGAFNFTAAGNNNVFGGGGNSSGGSTGSSTGAFNFSANQVAQVQPQPSAQGGLAFNIGTGGGQQMQGRRQIRQGTRRLK